jgi:hypothetical protein
VKAIRFGFQLAIHNETLAIEIFSLESPRVQIVCPSWVGT